MGAPAGNESESGVRPSVSSPMRTVAPAGVLTIRTSTEAGGGTPSGIDGANIDGASEPTPSTEFPITAEGFARSVATSFVLALDAALVPALAALGPVDAVPSSRVSGPVVSRATAKPPASNRIAASATSQGRREVVGKVTGVGADARASPTAAEGVIDAWRGGIEISRSGEPSSGATATSASSKSRMFWKRATSRALRRSSSP